MADSTKRVVERFVDEIANGRDLQRIDELLTEDFFLPIGDGRVDRDGLRSVLSYYFAAFPDLRYEVSSIIVDGNRAAAQVVMSGTHDGVDYAGHPPSGRSFAVAEIDVFTVVDGRISTYEIVWDELGFRRQLGLPLDA
jgi:steroid delta-isomerase-like uncharacterized protein